MLVFAERENWASRRKVPWSRVENQQIQPTYDAKSGNPTRATLVGGECSHHCATPAPCSPRSTSFKKIERMLKPFARAFTSAMLYALSYQANWELHVVIL